MGFTQFQEIPDEAPAQRHLLLKAIMELDMSLRRLQRLTEKRALHLKDKANGFYTRPIDTPPGSFQNVRVRRLRKESLPTIWFRRYQRRWPKLDHLLLRSCWMDGLSTRKAVKIMSRHFHWSLSPSAISRLSGMLTEALRRFRECAISDDYVGLIIDGAWYRFWQLYGPERGVLAVLGIKADGSVGLLGFHVARSESAQEGARGLRNLKERGLRGQSLEIIVADGAGGMEAAAAEVYPGAKFPRCCWHHRQTLKQHASSPRAGRRMMQEAARCYHNSDLRQIQRRRKRFLARWRDQQSKAIRLFETHLDQTLTYLPRPAHMHRGFRTTNYLERLSRNVRSRTQPLTAFHQPCHRERLVIGTLLAVDWIKWPCDLQPLFNPDTII